MPHHESSWRAEERRRAHARRHFGRSVDEPPLAVRGNLAGQRGRAVVDLARW